MARERRRIAADVHDLVMQDLAFALAGARSLADARGGRDATSAQLEAVVAAGERALAGARKLAEDLVCEERPPVVEAVRESVRMAARGIPMRFDATGVAGDAQPDAPTLHALVHIAREAVTNAVKHGQPDAIEAVLEHADEWRLRVTDDGAGYDTSRPGGFGLASMRRHAQAMGGLLIVVSQPGKGTAVEAVLP